MLLLPASRALSTSSFTTLDRSQMACSATMRRIEDSPRGRICLLADADPDGDDDGRDAADGDGACGKAGESPIPRGKHRRVRGDIILYYSSELEDRVEGDLRQAVTEPQC